jgi:hypothetical protein
MPEQEYLVKVSFRTKRRKITYRTRFDYVNAPPVPTAAPTVSPNGPKGTPTPAATEILDIANFEYLGTASLPQSAVGTSTGYSTGLLGVRKVGGELHFFSDTHIYSLGQLYEYKLPAFAIGENPPAAVVIKEWGDIYGSTRVDTDGAPITYPVNGLFWDNALGGLWWAGNPSYNTLNRASPSAGLVLINADGTFTPTAAQRFYVEGQSNTHWVRGCIIEVPSRFAAQFDNKSRAIGCGGYYSIIGGGSWGPALTVFDPDKISERKIVLGYPVSSDRRAPRPPDYYIADSAGAGAGWMGPNPVDGVGR